MVPIIKTYEGADAMKRVVSLILCIVCVFGLAGCASKPKQTTSPEPTDKPNADKIETISDAMTGNAFDDKFLSYIAGHTDGNYMVSPLSFRYALGLLLAGAEGDTKTELLNALGVQSVDEWTAYCTVFNGFIEQFYESSDTDDSNALRVPNSVWKRDDISEDFKEVYRAYISKNYDAEYNSFNRDNAVGKINAWVSDKTEKMIERLLPDSYDTSRLAVVIMNALYFKDNWVRSFNEGATEDGDFTTKDGSTVIKSFMQQTESFDYYSDDKTQIVILPLKGGVNMAFVLGDTANLAEDISKCELHRVAVRIPKLDIETSFDNKELVNFLVENGVSKAFDMDNADFSAMIGHQIWVDDIVQKTRIKTDENGVEAAAVTAIMMKDACCLPDEEPAVFSADRPFSFYIYATCNDQTAMLFAGQVVE